MKVGILAGSGFYDFPELQNGEEKSVFTEFGAPSDHLVQGTVGSVPCVVLARHGRGHRFNPSQVNYRANLLAMKRLGVTHVLAATCCGSLRSDHAPGHFVFLDSFIDRTTSRCQTFHTNPPASDQFGTVCHIPMHPSFCPELRSVLVKAAADLGLKDVHASGTVVTIEGPRFSSRAESNMFRAWGADVINMTTVPEVVLAKELGLSYASVAMVTDYDCWKEDEEPVNVPLVMARMSDNVSKVRSLFVKAIGLMETQDWKPLIAQNQQLADRSVVSK